MRIICEHISKNYRLKDRSLDVLADITVQTQEHDFICLLGPNGCGKTTLLRILAGILEPSAGRVVFDAAVKGRRAVSLVFQEHSLFPWLSAKDNMCFHLEMRGVPRKERYAQAQPFIHEMGLSAFVDYYPEQLSTGMKQKVNLIRGLLTDAEALLIDEPDRSLDVYSKLVAYKDIYRAWDAYKKTIIHVTHDVDTALEMARTVWIMGSSPARIIRVFPIDGEPGKRSQDKDLQASLQGLKKEIVGILEQEALKSTA